MNANEYRTNPRAREIALRLQQRVAGNAPIRLAPGIERELVGLALAALLADLALAPVDMVMYCPKCGTQHIDAPHGEWTNPPHRTHQCQACGHLWRPSDAPTNGIQATASGKDADTLPLVQLLNVDGPVPFPDFKPGPWKMEPAKVGPRGPLSDAQRAHALAVGRNVTLGAAVALAAATAYVNGVQDCADITPSHPFAHGLHPGHEGEAFNIAKPPK